MTAIVYDTETFPNVFLFSVCTLGNSGDMVTWEISHRRDDRNLILTFFEFCRVNSIEMIGFNNLAFDYPICHFLYYNSGASANDLFQLSQQIIFGGERFAHHVWQSDRFAPQIDLFKIHHFDNLAKSTGLKALEFNMRSPHLSDMPVAVGSVLTDEQIDRYLIPYNRVDVGETNRFAEISAPNIAFRREMASVMSGDVINFNDTKIGKQLIEQRLGDELCFTRDANGKKQPRQTFRDSIILATIIFPYIQFTHPEFRRVLDYLKGQTIIETKGVFAGVTATINGFAFNFGTGGIHGSTERKVYQADAECAIIDLDVAALYPSIAIENQLYPAHLGMKFVEVYRGIRDERKKYAKGTVMNAALKLSANGAYGDSNNPYSVLYDPQFTMAITINGQLLLCMLAEWLLSVPTLEIIQINTDGITYRIKRHYEVTAKQIWDRWQSYTRLILEETRYGRMFIRDVNNYLAETEDRKKLKSKGAYWYPVKFPDDISNASPSAWYKDLGAQVIARAVEAAMIDGIPPEIYIPMRLEPFDFMLRAKASRGATMYVGERPAQRLTRYYVARRGAPLRIVRPPVAGAEKGEFKRRPGISNADYYRVVQELATLGQTGQWDHRIHTKNKSVHDDRETSVHVGRLVAECNVASDFDWDNVDFGYYIEEARKLIIQ